MEKKTGMRLSHICCLFYQLCVLSNGITSGLQPLGDSEEWEIVYPALWSRGQQEPTGGSGAGGSCSTDGNCGNSSSNISATSASTQVVGSSREVRSVSSSSHRQLQPVGDTSEDEGSEDEYESQEFYHWSPLPQGSNATTQLLPPPPLSSSEDGDEVLLRIPAFAQELYLLLKRDSRFLAPGFAVEERLLSERRSLPNSSQTQTERSCYYSGSVLHFPGSFASFSTCGGLVQVTLLPVLALDCSLCSPEAPGGQVATERFHLDWDTVLSSSLGTVVVRFDGRGSGNQGLKLLHEVHHQLGSLDIKDHIALMQLLAQLPYVDRRRTAVYGKAYGGFLALKLMATAGDLFKCGAAVAPITSFRFHAATFSERYLGMPAREDAAYTVASVLQEAAHLKDRKFLLAHGTGDATVHFQHTAELLVQLLAAESNYTTQIYPDESHTFFLKTNQRHLRQALFSFFQSCFEDSERVHLLADEDEDS